MNHHSYKSTDHSIDNTVIIADHERRSEPRFPVIGPCYLVWSDGENEICACGTIQDMSVNGMRVRMRPRARAGEKMHIFIGDRKMVIGQVRHCTENPDGSCDIGILIQATPSDRRVVA